MRNLFALVGAGLLTFFGIGYYLNWYQIGTAAGSSGHEQVTIDFDAKKISADVQKGAANSIAKLHEFMDTSKSADSKHAEPAKPEVATSEPRKAVSGE